nr:immunoglobulin light chain junction region [Macaca mulatta]MOX78957.1 immunoglobulin light chain junction region [Macaca mulatta]MOX79492.1 immunoglobulin light chain junction region [Macaca mulatta]MOX83153.1 immunoglobulin light chain junction region [Macaca mulatta]MOX83970.1 immunoglobulin light chain junction region [Macaca mulatta]
DYYCLIWHNTAWLF